jgi:hypothetical protein
MSSPAVSKAPSYIQEIEWQFASNPLPDFQLLNNDKPFLSYPMDEADSSEILTPPFIPYHYPHTCHS